MRISDWSSDVCSSDLDEIVRPQDLKRAAHLRAVEIAAAPHHVVEHVELGFVDKQTKLTRLAELGLGRQQGDAGEPLVTVSRHRRRGDRQQRAAKAVSGRSEEHTSELPSLMRISYAVFCLE